MKKVLIFDDDEDILAICTYVLEDAGWEVIAYTDCRDVIARTAAFRPDVILMDNWIPDEGGIVATQILKKDPVLQRIPVIYFSANSNIGELAITAGADHVLAKPFDLEDLRLTVLKALK
ncbi:response regulator [Mucilaginibacter corticis]|uniref:Response regulator n=1 Tax=Mucilaginibacter corticis TaxID=2597670 RepID=A0A556M903_9SPHI|nr:response regulator [Mucilaginibacter corticis]TSJ36373.1 response regulator [Mucilaginibacter corticis]